MATSNGGAAPLGFESSGDGDHHDQSIEYPAEVTVNAALLLEILEGMEKDLFQQAGKLQKILAEINEEELPKRLVKLKGPEAMQWNRTEDGAVQQPFIVTAGAAYLYGSSVVPGLEAVVGNATKEAASSYIYQPRASDDFIRGTMYSQYEVAVPASTAGDCYRGAMEMFYGPDVDEPIG
eukprot:scaffold110655_cov42-Prasinocladus_malaysianus.AAC.1